MQRTFKLSALALCLAFALSGCNILDNILTGPGKCGTDEYNEQMNSKRCIPIGAVSLTELDRVRLMVSAYTMTGIELEGDNLCLAVEYSGGCAEHEFWLHIDKNIRESNPAKVSAILAHNTNQDACEALVQKRLGFDLKPLKEYLRQTTGQEHGSVLIEISHGKDVLYTY